MSRILLGVLTVALGLSLGYTLECYKCDIGFWSLCITSKETCEPNQLCYSGKGNAAGFIDVTMKGCLDISECNKTTNVDFPADKNTTVYKMTKTCCSGELCNTATPLANAHILSFAIASLTSLIVTKVLV